MGNLLLCFLTQIGCTSSFEVNGRRIADKTILKHSSDVIAVMLLIYDYDRDGNALARG